MSRAIVFLEVRDSSALRPASLHAVTFARNLSQTLGISYSLALIGSNISGLVDSVRGYGAERVYVVDDPSLSNACAENYVPTLRRIVNLTRATYVIGAATAAGKDILPRLAGTMGSAFISDCVGFEEVEDRVLWRRPLCAGNVIAYCASDTVCTVLTVRHAEFEAACTNGGLSSVELVEAAPVDAAAARIEPCSFESIDNPRPELTEARVVVSGGRALAGHFFEVLGPLADTLGAALGATRAACDGGFAPGDFQVGQTGKVVAPDLYFAIGISGAIQHVAGMKGARVVVAINSDPEAPIVSMADYSLIGDLFQIVPELVTELRRHTENT
jgi:electron transfer flavoprotein alpha subunit